MRRERLAVCILLGVGLALRFHAIQTQETSPDAVGFARRARHFTFLDPWHHDWREPGYVALLKVAGAPFGYRIGIGQVVALLAGMGALIVWWRLGRRFGPAAGALVLAALTFAPAAATDVAYGTREAPALLLVGLVLLLMDRRLTWAGVVAGLTVGGRFELGVLLVVAVGMAAWMQRNARPFLAALAVGVVAIGPLMAANASYYGDPMYGSKVHVSANRNKELALRGEAVPKADPSYPKDDARSLDYFAGPLIGWPDFYLGVLGPAESARRIVHGSIHYGRTLLSGATPFRGGAGEDVSLLLLAGLVVVGVRRHDAVLVSAAWIAGAGVLGFAALYVYDPTLRLVGFTMGPLMLLAASGVHRLGERPGPEASTSRSRRCEAPEVEHPEHERVAARSEQGAPR